MTLDKNIIDIIIDSPECDRMWALSLSGLLNSLVHPTCVLMKKNPVSIKFDYLIRNARKYERKESKEEIKDKKEKQKGRNEEKREKQRRKVKE